MKKINKFIMITVLLLSTGYLFSQTTQMSKWPINGKEVDFVNNQINTIGQSLSSPQFTSNGYYDDDDVRLFHIIDNNLWWGDGTSEGSLFTDLNPVTQPDYMFPEMLVLPKDTLVCEGDFFVFYGVHKKYERELGKSYVVDHQFSVLYNTVTPDDSYLGTFRSNRLLVFFLQKPPSIFKIAINPRSFLYN